MTLIAQRIDNENRDLIKKNAELNIEFKSQEKDRELLIKQIIQQKKINQNAKVSLAKQKKIAEEIESRMKQQELLNPPEPAPPAK